MTGERPRRLFRVVAWLLTPVVAWAASFFGGWLGAAIGKGAARSQGGLLWLGTGALIGGAVGAVVWVVLVRRWSAGRGLPGGGAGERSNVEPQNNELPRREQ